MAAIFLAATSREARGVLFTVFTKCGRPKRQDASGSWFWEGNAGGGDGGGAVAGVADGRDLRELEENVSLGNGCQLDHVHVLVPLLSKT